MRPDFRHRLHAGQLLIGTILTLPSPEIAELMARSGFDWLFIDTEHGPFETLECQRMIQATADRCACIVRVPQADELHIKKALDIGADGIVAPRVNSAQHAQSVVDSCKYPPAGRRSVGLARAQGYGLDFTDYLATANDLISVVIQAEHVEAVMNIDSIVSVGGIDAVLIGPYDLSASMGKMGEVSDPEVVDAIDRVARACKSANVKLGFFGVAPEDIKPYIDEGYSLIVCGTDAMFLASGAANTINQLRLQEKTHEKYC